MAVDMCIIGNRYAGRGRAARRMAALRKVFGGRAHFFQTDAPEHAEELALQSAQGGYTVVGAAGGDGTVHEVVNGLIRSGRPDVVLAIFPIGSANDYAASIGLKSKWWRQPPAELTTRAVDVGRVRSPDGRERYFINGLGLGLNGIVTEESRKIRWLRGIPLYGLALLRAMWFRYDCVPMTISIDGQTRTGPTLALTVNIGKREGGFTLTPNAKVDDGLFDYLHAGPLRRWQLLGYLPAMITGQVPTNDPLIQIGRCKEVRVATTSPLTIHMDGEFFNRPASPVTEVTIQILPGALRVQTA